jgi:hypothetical protein
VAGKGSPANEEEVVFTVSPVGFVVRLI